MNFAHPQKRHFDSFFRNKFAAPSRARSPTHPHLHAPPPPSHGAPPRAPPRRAHPPGMSRRKQPSPSKVRRKYRGGLPGRRAPSQRTGACLNSGGISYLLVVLFFSFFFSFSLRARGGGGGWEKERGGKINFWEGAGAGVKTLQRVGRSCDFFKKKKEMLVGVLGGESFL